MGNICQRESSVAVEVPIKNFAPLTTNVNEQANKNVKVNAVKNSNMNVQVNAVGNTKKNVQVTFCTLKKLFV
jgi:hypothetical protein